MAKFQRYSVKSLFFIGLLCAVVSLAVVTITAFTSTFWITSSADALVQQSMSHAANVVEASKTLSSDPASLTQLSNAQEKAVQAVETNRVALQAEKFQVFLILSAVAMAALLVLAVGIGLLSRVIFPSINQFLDAFEEYSAGELSYRVVEEKMPEELSRVASGFNTMASKLQQSYSKLAYQSMNDEMTGVYNRRRFIMDLEREVKRAKRYKRTLSLMLIDMDDFSAINENHGHESGDKVLCKVVDFIYQSIRDSDSLYRYGSEEFAVILVEIDDKHTEIVAERIRKSICESPFALPGGVDVKASASIGIANFPNNADNEINLIHAADEALYRAKEEGKNKVIYTKEFSHAKVG